MKYSYMYVYTHMIFAAVLSPAIKTFHRHLGPNLLIFAVKVSLWFHRHFTVILWHITAKKHRPRWFLAKTRCACCMSLRSEFRVVMSITNSASKQCSLRLYLQLFVGVLISFLHYLCLLRIVVSNTYFVVCLFRSSSSYVPHVAIFSGLPIVDCPFGIL